MKMLTIEEREELKKGAITTIEMVDNYPKKFDVMVCIWANGKTIDETITEVESQLRRLDFPATISSWEEVEDY